MTTTTPQLHIQSAVQLLYKPRNTSYRVLHHNVKIKQNIGLLELVFSKLYLIDPPPKWKLGCVYVSATTNDTQLYTRPYDMFDDRWDVIK